MPLWRRRMHPVLKLHRDAQTPHGAVWSCIATADEARRIAAGEALDPAKQLRPGDIVTVRPPSGRGRTFTARVVGRNGDLVYMERLRQH